MHDKYDFEWYNPLSIPGSVADGDFYIRAKWTDTISGFKEVKNCCCDE